MTDLLMSHGEAKIVKDAFESMIRKGKGPSFAKAFYDHLFAGAPEIRAWFPKEMVDQNRKLVKTLGILLANLPEWRGLVGPVRALAPQHASFPIETQHFEMFATCLFKAMEDTTGEKMAPEATIPFRMALLRIGAEMMKAMKAL